jgi:hypothetical protein
MPGVIEPTARLAVELTPVTYGLLAAVLIGVHTLVDRRATIASKPDPRSGPVWLAGWTAVGVGAWAGWYSFFQHWFGFDLTITDAIPMVGVALAAGVGAYAAATGQFGPWPRVLGTALAGIVVGAALWICFYNARYGATKANAVGDFGVSVTEWIILVNLTLFGFITLVCVSATSIVAWLEHRSGPDDRPKYGTVVAGT